MLEVVMVGVVVKARMLRRYAPLGLEWLHRGALIAGGTLLAVEQDVRCNQRSAVVRKREYHA